MSRQINLGNKIAQYLPAVLVKFIHTAGDIASSQEGVLYLVGGAVRDLILGKDILDMDLVVEGNAIQLAKSVAEEEKSTLTTHPQFHTARIEWKGWNIDIATARTESYARAGALPTVLPSTIDKDLFRRDFTINAMAICLSPERYGELIDFYGGQRDIEHKLIRILHKNSFVDDATRIWRGLRYEQRLGFNLEEKTLEILNRDVPMLDTISGDRILYEIECIFREEKPEQVFKRAEELGVLSRLHPDIRGDEWLSEKFKIARIHAEPESPASETYLALLLYRLSEKESEVIIAYLNLSTSVTRIIRDTIGLKERLKTLSHPWLKRSTIYHIVRDYFEPAIKINAMATGSPIARKHLELYLKELRYIKPSLNGHALMEMGLEPGPKIKEMLTLLQNSRLDQKVNTEGGERELVKDWLARN